MGLLDKLTKPFSGLLGGGASDVPQYQSVQADAGTNALLDEQVAQSRKSREDLVREQLEGTQDAGQLIQKENRTNTSLGMAQPDQVSKALQVRSQKAFDRDYGKLKNEVSLGAVDTKAKNMGAAAQGVGAAQNLAMNNYEGQLAQHTAQVNARNEVLRNVLGLAGMAGGAMAGGPAGARLGGAAGQSMGPQKKALPGRYASRPSEQSSDE